MIAATQPRCRNVCVVKERAKGGNWLIALKKWKREIRILCICKGTVKLATKTWLVLRLVCSGGGWGGGGYFWEILVGVCRTVLQILPLFHTKNANSPHPFSDLASNIISSLSDQKLFRLERQHKIHSEFACYRSFLYSFGIETTERLKLSQSSLQTNMCEVYIGIPFSDRNDTNTIPFGAAQTSIWLI